MNKYSLIALLFFLSFLPWQKTMSQSSNYSGPQGSNSVPLVLPGSNSNATAGARLLNSSVGVIGRTSSARTSSLNFGSPSLGRLSPPAGLSGVSGIGRLASPGGQPNLTVIPNLAGPPALSGGASINPAPSPFAAGRGGPIVTSDPPSINPTNPISNNFQVNPTGSSGLRNPSNNYRPVEDLV